MKRVVIDIRASKNISGLVKVTVTSPAGLMNFFLNVEPCTYTYSTDILRYRGIFKKYLITTDMYMNPFISRAALDLLSPKKINCLFPVAAKKK